MSSEAANSLTCIGLIVGSIVFLGFIWLAYFADENDERVEKIKIAIGIPLLAIAAVIAVVVVIVIFVSSFINTFR